MTVKFSDISEPYTVVTPQCIASLIEAASDAPLRRARLCLHCTPDDQLHEMIIAFRRDSFVQPHRHPAKTESFNLLEGELDVVFFDAFGQENSRVRLSSINQLFPRIYRLRAPLWHTLVLRSDHVVLHEVTNGPWRDTDTEIAPWAPHPGDPQAIKRFLSPLLR
jgi:cupin fold WbuC family metalloprotein